MPNYTFKGADERYYTDLGLNAKPGDEVQLERALDDQWELVEGETEPAPAVEPEPVVEEPVVEVGPVADAAPVDAPADEPHVEDHADDHSDESATDHH